MSIFVSNAKSSSIYVLSSYTDPMPGVTQDPRPFNKAIHLYFSKGRNNLTTPSAVQQHKAYSERFTSDYNSYCCLNCQTILTDDKVVCSYCCQRYCGFCSELYTSCPSCNQNTKFGQTL